MEDREKYLGESLLSKQPEKKLILTLRDGSVTTDKIADKSVTPGKLADSVKTQLVDPSIRTIEGKLDIIDKKSVKSITLNGSRKIFPDLTGNISLVIELQDGNVIVTGGGAINELLEGLYAKAGVPLVLPLRSVVDNLDSANISSEVFNGDASIYQKEIIWDNSRGMGLLPYEGTYYYQWQGAPEKMASSLAYKSPTDNIYYVINNDLLVFYCWDNIRNRLVSTIEEKDFYFIDINTSDLDIRDEDGNILVEFRDGHIRTEKFDSSQILDRINNLSTISPVQIVSSINAVTDNNVIYFVVDNSESGTTITDSSEIL